MTPEARRTYLSRVRVYLAWLAGSDVDGDPLTTASPRASCRMLPSSTGFSRQTGRSVGDGCGAQVAVDRLAADAELLGERGLAFAGGGALT
jgi:hypothetical protein